MTNDERQAYEELLEGMDCKLRSVAERLPPYVCYRQKGQEARHYQIHAYIDTDPVQIVVIHGRDSTLPGVAGSVWPDTLEKCGCGLWEPPTDAQVMETTRRIAEIGELRKLGIGQEN